MKEIMKKNNVIPVFCMIMVLLSAALFGCGSSKSSSNTTSSNTQGLKVEDIKVGNGNVVTKGSKVTVHYVGTLTNGTKFDSSRDRNRPLTFEIGEGNMIEGWEIGLVGMKVGGIRKLTVPPELGYGDEDHNKIPANSILLFEIELLNVE